MEKLNLYQKLLKISDEIGVVPKNLTIALGSGKYKAVGEIDVLNAVKPIEVKYGVLSFPIDHTVIESKELEKKDNRVDQFIRVKVTYRFINVDNPSEFIDTTALGDGVDGGDKASGKAQTYADKYALLKAYKIATGEDPDQEASKEYEKPKNDPIKPAAKPATTNPDNAKAPDGELPPFMDVFAVDTDRLAALNEISKLLGDDATKVTQWLTRYGTTPETLTPSVTITLITRIKERQKQVK